MVVLQKPDNQLYAAIVRSLKQNSRSEFQPPFVAPHGDRKVRIRTGCHYQSQLPEDHWQEKYNRNVKQSVQGFYTPAHVPYASVGDVCLNVKDHVVKTVGGEQSQEKCKNPSLAADLCEQEKKKDEDRVETSQKKQKLQGLKKKACFSFQDEGGLSEIKAKLFQYRGRLSALRACQTFQECLKKKDFMLMYVEAMKELSQKQAECAISPHELKTMLNKMRPSERLDAPLLGDELIPALPSEIKSDHEEEIIDQRVLDTFDKIETWDDLLQAGEKPPSNPQAPLPEMARSSAANKVGARGGVTRTSFLNTDGWKMVFGGIRQRRYGILQSLVNQTQNVATVEQTPLWHQVATSEKNAKDNGTTSTFTKRRVKKSPSKIENSLSGMMSEGFEKIQTKSAERVRSKLNKVNRKERESFVRKVLVLEPSSLYKVDLKRVQQAGTDVSEDCDKQDVQTARWFEDLEREAQELGLQRTIEVICLFSKLYPFAIDDVTTIHFAQAKLFVWLSSPSQSMNYAHYQ